MKVFNIVNLLYFHRPLFLLCFLNKIMLNKQIQKIFIESKFEEKLYINIYYYNYEL